VQQQEAFELDQQLAHLVPVVASEVTVGPEQQLVELQEQQVRVQQLAAQGLRELVVVEQQVQQLVVLVVELELQELVVELAQLVVEVGPVALSVVDVLVQPCSTVAQVPEPAAQPVPQQQEQEQESHAW
jgi:hypothetical protein